MECPLALERGQRAGLRRRAGRCLGESAGSGIFNHWRLRSRSFDSEACRIARLRALQRALFRETRSQYFLLGHLAESPVASVPHVPESETEGTDALLAITGRPRSRHQTGTRRTRT